jgi:hypothetical protein
MLQRVKFDDSDRIYFNFEDTSLEELDNSGLSYFDVYNLPYLTYDVNSYRLKNYFLSYFKSSKSNTGYVGMFVHKDKEIFKKLIGYTEDTKLEISYAYGA